MSGALRFQYYTIRPAVDFGDHTESYFGPEVDWGYGWRGHTPDEAFQEAIQDAEGRPIFWTLYGVDEENHDHAIGDFTSFEAAYEIMQAILLPMRNAADSGDLTLLEDICNQSTNEDRL